MPPQTRSGKTSRSAKGSSAFSAKSLDQKTKRPATKASPKKILKGQSKKTVTSKAPAATNTQSETPTNVLTAQTKSDHYEHHKNKLMEVCYRLKGNILELHQDLDRFQQMFYLFDGKQKASPEVPMFGEVETLLEQIDAVQSGWRELQESRAVRLELIPYHFRRAILARDWDDAIEEDHLTSFRF